ncbi:MAG: PorP/SprF family type IX secretion system membrane protein [Bacteroidota bacterium]
MKTPSNTSTKRIGSLLLLLLCWACASNSVTAQSVFSKNIYIANPARINPAYMGSQGQFFLGFQSSIIGENQFDLPTYSSINTHYALRDNLGIGANFLSESQGPLSITSADGGASYTSAFGEDHSISFGMTLGFFRSTLNGDVFTANPLVNPDDPLLAEDFLDESYMKMGAGIVYRYKNLELGIGAPYLFRGGQRFNEAANALLTYRLHVEAAKLRFSPSVFYDLRQDEPNIFDLNVLSEWNDIIGLLIGYRSNESINAGLYINTGFVQVGYNYNSALSNEVQGINDGNHELLVAMRLTK